MKPAAFQATYSDFKLVKTRKVAQLIFEVPIEGVDAALAVLGGMPDPSKERWVGIAPLKAPAEATEPATVTKGKQQWRDMLPSAQAAIRCNEPIFWAYLKEQHSELVDRNPTNADQCAEVVRGMCGVVSRSELNTKHQARTIWFNLDEGFAAWKALEHA